MGRGFRKFSHSKHERTEAKRRFEHGCRAYPHTRVKIPLEVGVKRALELDAFMTGIPYDRYDKGRGSAR